MENQINILSDAAQAQEPKTLDDQKPTPDIDERGGVTDTPQPEQPAPEVTDSAAAVETDEQARTDKAVDPAPPAPADKTSEPEKSVRRGKQSKEDKPTKEPVVAKEKKIPTLEEYKARGQKAAATRKDSRQKTEDFLAGKRTSPFSDGKPIPEKLPVPEQPPQPKEAPRPNGKDEIVYLNLSELHAFKNHPFGVRDDSEMKALVESVRVGGVNQPALVRPREDGGYEIIAGHRRQKASELAGYFEMPCIVREMTDDEAILAMTDDNLRQRSEILPSEKAQSLKMQFEAVKHQGARDTSGQNVPKGDAGKRSIEIVGERNNMIGKQVQRYIRLTELVPDLQKAMDEKKLGFTPAVEISFIKPKNQNFIAVALDSQQSSPSLAQAKRMRELDGKGLLNGDVIDGILCEQKKEVDKVIISGEELNKYFGKDKTPQEMKNQIIKLLDEWAGKEKTLAAPEKKPALEK